jgi:arginine exporter protein ArgO
MVEHRVALQLIGGLVSIVLGLRSLKGQASRWPAAARPDGLVTGYVSTLLLTLANPQTTLSFIAAFAALGLAAPDRLSGHAGTLVVGVFLGSAAWWLMLSFGGAWLRARLSATRTLFFGRIAGVLLVALGRMAVLELLIL